MNSRFPIAGARGVVEFSYGAELSGGYSPLSEPSEPGVSWSLSRVLDADLRFFKLALSSAANRPARLEFGVGGPCFLLPVFEFIWSTVPNHTISRNLAQCGPSGGRGQLRCGCPRIILRFFVTRRATRLPRKQPCGSVRRLLEPFQAAQSPVWLRCVESGHKLP